MVIQGLFSNGVFQKKNELWPSRILICVLTSTSSLIFSWTAVPPQSSPLSISIFLSLCLLFYPPYTRISDQLAYMQVCMVCMYACVHIGVHCWQDGVSLRGSNTDGTPFVWVCRMETPRMGLSRVILLPNWDQGDLSQVSHLSGCTHVCIYACTCMGAYACVHAWVHMHACVWVGLGKLHG